MCVYIHMYVNTHIHAYTGTPAVLPSTNTYLPTTSTGASPSQQERANCPRRSLPPPKAGMAYPSLYLPIPFPLLDPPGRSIQFTQQTRGALLCARYSEKNPSLKRKKRGKAEGKEATCIQQCLYTEEHVLGAYVCVCVRAYVCVCVCTCTRAHMYPVVHTSLHT